MKIAIFSDLHIDPIRAPEHETLFVQTLRDLRQNNCQELWLLGDIFDLMVGPFEFWTKVHSEFFKEITLWTQNKKSVVWVQGNHDFYLEDLLRKFNIEVHDTSVIKIIQNKKIYLAHGDLINTEDHAYLKWRRFTRSKRFRIGLKLIPSFVRNKLIQNVGKNLSNKSRLRHQNTPPDTQTRELFLNFAQTLWRNDVQGVCLGHSHQADLIQNNSNDFYLNLGSWLNYSPRYALWDSLSENSPRVVEIK